MAAGVFFDKFKTDAIGLRASMKLEDLIRMVFRAFSLHIMRNQK
jgi:hypothetical protein